MKHGGQNCIARHEGRAAITRTNGWLPSVGHKVGSSNLLKAVRQSGILFLVWKRRRFVFSHFSSIVEQSIFNIVCLCLDFPNTSILLFASLDQRSVSFYSICPSDSFTEPRTPLFVLRWVFSRILYIFFISH